MTECRYTPWQGVGVLTISIGYFVWIILLYRVNKVCCHMITIVRPISWSKEMALSCHGVHESPTDHYLLLYNDHDSPWLLAPVYLILWIYPITF